LKRDNFVSGRQGVRNREKIGKGNERDHVVERGSSQDGDEVSADGEHNEDGVNVEDESSCSGDG
jgi:hypothetical protein